MTVIADPMFVSVLVVVIGIPVYQCVLLPRICKYLPNMLKRMGLGLMLCLAKEVSELVITVTAPVGCVSKERSPQLCFFHARGDTALAPSDGAQMHADTSCGQGVDLYHFFPTHAGVSPLALLTASPTTWPQLLNGCVRILFKDGYYSMYYLRKYSIYIYSLSCSGTIQVVCLSECFTFFC